MTASQSEAQCREVEQGIKALVEWVVATRIDDIPPPVLRKAAMVVADDLAAMMAARAEPEVVRVQSQLIAMGGKEEATVFRGGRPRTDRISAALANGIAGSWCELDEGYRLAPCHGGLYTLPALFADAEILGLSVGDLLRAEVLSYEIAARFARCWAFPQMTLHPHAQTAAIGGAAATGLARNLNAREFLDALNAAASLVTVGEFGHAVEGALVRNVWAAVGCTNGMRAADWAQCGIGGMPSSAFATYSKLLGQPPTPKYLAEGLGTDWAISSGFHKIYACCQSAHSAVEAMLMALERIPASKASTNVERIVLETHRPGMSNRAPATSLAAKFSFEHALATTQVHGHAKAEAFAAETLSDPRISRLRNRVELKKFEPLLPNERPARLTLRFEDGNSITTECRSASGGPDRPFADEVILEKITSIAEGVYPQFMSVMRSMMALDQSRIKTRWDATVAEFTAH